MSHDSKSAERLALGWHGIALLVAGALALNALIFGLLLSFAQESERTFYVLLPWTSRMFFIAGFIEASAVLWHIWAVKQHRERLKFLNEIEKP